MTYFNYYFEMVKEYLKFNRINLNDYRGYSYSVTPYKDYIIVYLPYKRYKIDIRELENFFYTIKGGNYDR